MSEQKKSGCLKVLMIFVMVNVLILLVAGGAVFVIWKKKGSPSMADLKARLEEKAAGGMTEGGDSGNGGAGAGERRPVVATAPIQAGADTYARFTQRSDVLTLVNYYSDT